MRKVIIKQVREHIQEVWEASGRSEEDPGLREHFNEKPRLPVTVVCSHLDKEINHGNILRISECFRAEEVIFGTRGGDILDISGSVGAQVWQPWRWSDAEEILCELKAKGYHLYALHLSPQAKAVQKMTWQFPAALVLGQELEGFRPEVLALCDEHVAIPLYGLITSLNVAVATGICMHHIADYYHHHTPTFTPARAVSQRLVK